MIELKFFLCGVAWALATFVAIPQQLNRQLKAEIAYEHQLSTEWGTYQ